MACGAPALTRAELEAGVHTTVLDSLFARDSARVLLVAPLHADPLRWLDRETDSLPSDTAAARRELARRGITADLAADFVAANARRDSVRLPIAARLPVLLDALPPVSPAGRDSLLRRANFGAGFERVRRAYPGATQVVELSRVGFSGDRRRALVYVQSHCGMMCAAGWLVILERTRGRWRIAELESLWVS